jgi:PD-(D/E)XK nuclease superfamily
MENKLIDITPELGLIIKEFAEALLKRHDYELGFNVFSIVSDTYYYENLHSRILHALLDPNGKHNEGRLFLDLFLDHLNIDKSGYQDRIGVYNEHSIENQKRIDILIRSSSNAIIIENKINNATDQNNQLVDYYHHCKANGLRVDAILYLSRDGKKLPDKNKWECDEEISNEIDKILQRLSAYDVVGGNDIYNWLEKSKNASRNDDTKFFIRQYQQLLKHLRGYIMETTALKKYHDLISNTDKTKAEDIGNLVEMHNSLVLYYPQKLIESIPYPHAQQYSSQTVIFGRIFGDNGCYLKVIFHSNNKADLLIMDNTKRWLQDDKLKKDVEFMSFFENDEDAGGEWWIGKKTDYNLISDFNVLVDDVKFVLALARRISIQSN